MAEENTDAEENPNAPVAADGEQGQDNPIEGQRPRKKAKRPRKKAKRARKKAQPQKHQPKKMTMLRSVRSARKALLYGWQPLPTWRPC